MNNLTNLTQGYKNLKEMVKEKDSKSVSDLLTLFGNISILIYKCEMWMDANPNDTDLNECKFLYYKCQSLQTQIEIYMYKFQN